MEDEILNAVSVDEANTFEADVKDINEVLEEGDV